MPQLDRFLSVMVGNNAEAIVLIEGDVATLQKDGVPRPITKQPLSAAQLMMLLKEIAPASAAKKLDAGSAATFDYANSDGAFTVKTALTGGRWHARIGMGNGAEVVETPEDVVEPEIPEEPEAPEPELTGTPVPKSRLSVATSEEERLEAAKADMDDLLTMLVQRKASDLHLRCGEPPLIRVDGEMVRIEGYPTLDNDTLEAMLRGIMPGKNRQEFADKSDTDYAYEIDGLARFRCNALRERKGAAGVFRVIPTNVATVEH